MITIYALVPFIFLIVMIATNETQEIAVGTQKETTTKLEIHPITIVEVRLLFDRR